MTYQEGSFLAYLDQMKRLAFKAGLPEIVLITFVLNGLSDDIGGTLLMNATEDLSWSYIYNACEGLYCSNRASQELRKDSVVKQSSMEICKVKKVFTCFFL
ncbi:hypothetical protein NGRA_2429 [Nosema granulosis]|uniref:Uncharacterized protein n=1 Tax=Nosema granulosis TaxID=83296 RepID=A0A9P6KY59_9MICR|nr:hypothetical protein NGRA_2429 [Nosema granulosis]